MDESRSVAVPARRYSRSASAASANRSSPRGSNRRAPESLARYAAGKIVREDLNGLFHAFFGVEKNFVLVILESSNLWDVNFEMAIVLPRSRRRWRSGETRKTPSLRLRSSFTRITDSDGRRRVAQSGLGLQLRSTADSCSDRLACDNAFQIARLLIVEDDDRDVLLHAVMDCLSVHDLEVVPQDVLERDRRVAFGVRVLLWVVRVDAVDGVALSTTSASFSPPSAAAVSVVTNGPPVPARE